jgi:uncharacterized protein YbjT (DUF2867 family)
VELVTGDFGDSDAMAAACAGVDAVFSVQPAVLGEVEGAAAIAQAARAAGVKTMIHTSVSSTGWREGLPPEKASASKIYWDCKEAAERIMFDAGFEIVAILKPAFMMENFLLPKAPGMFPDLPNREIVMALAADKTFPAIATRDIGAAAFAVATRPDEFNRKYVELAGDALTITDYGRIIGEVIGAPIKVQSLPAAEVVARGQSVGWVESQAWSSEFGYVARPDDQRAFGLEPTSFRTWAEAHAEGLREATGLA